MNATPSTAHSLAERKARYGHRYWIVYRLNGELRAECASAESLKAALLASGTQGKFTAYTPSTATPLRVGWRIGINMMHNARRGYLNGAR